MENLTAFANKPILDLARENNISIEVLPDLDSLYLHFARSIADEVKENNKKNRKTSFIFPVGPIGQYPVLVKISNEEKISWHSVHIFNMDEYCDWQGRAIDPRHPLSFRGFMQREFIEQLEPEIRILEGNVQFPDPLNLDQISTRIKDIGGIDTCYGGIGYHGHVAFNEPIISRWYQISADDFRNSKTRLLQLAPETVVMNSIRSTGGNPALLPPMAVSLGMGDIYNSKKIRLYCQGGAWQRTVLRIAITVHDDVRYPVTLLNRHLDLKIITTEDTAKNPVAEIAA